MTREAETAVHLLDAFAARTGLTGAAAPQRYLWTDAHAVAADLALFCLTGVAGHAARAEALIDQVHRTLGRHRDDDARAGWLSGLSEEEGARHPARAGLRIGKPLPERPADEPLDEQAEWDRDGQYFHYLTRWASVLARASQVLGVPRHRQAAAELCAGVLPAFLRRDRNGAPAALWWKMSIDLTHPQVPGSNPQDALDGYVTFRWLGRAGAGVGDSGVVLAQVLEHVLGGESHADTHGGPEPDQGLGLRLDDPVDDEPDRQDPRRDPEYGDELEECGALGGEPAGEGLEDEPDQPDHVPRAGQDQQDQQQVGARDPLSELADSRSHLVQGPPGILDQRQERSGGGGHVSSGHAVGRRVSPAWSFA